jgi:hypothetical protein
MHTIVKISNVQIALNLINCYAILPSELLEVILSQLGQIYSTFLEKFEFF